MATLTVQVIARAGLTPTLAAAASGGDEFANEGYTFVEVVNAHASASRTITIVTQSTVDSQAVADRTVVVAGPARAFIGPFATGTYNTANDRVQLTYSDSAANLTVGAFRLTPA